MKLSVQNLSKTFSGENGKLDVLLSISMEIKKGEFVSIIGPSGCGKSTLFNIIAGIDNATSGNIYIDSNKIGVGKLGYMLQKPLLLPWKTVLENIMLGGIVRKIPKETAKEQSLDLLKQTGLLEFANHFPKSLSGGMAQRIALLRTIMFNKQLLLMDEPFGALDMLTRLSLQMWLLKLWQSLDSTVLFITHDVREAILLSDRIYVFSKRPAIVLEEIKIDLPRPRRREFLAKPKAVLMEQELEELLLGEETI